MSLNVKECSYQIAAREFLIIIYLFEIIIQFQQAISNPIKENDNLKIVT